MVVKVVVKVADSECDLVRLIYLKKVVRKSFHTLIKLINYYQYQIGSKRVT